MLKEILANKGIALVSIGWSSYILENVVLSHNREEIIHAVGPDMYYTIYSVLSTASCGAIAYAYFRHCRTSGPIIKRNPYISQVIGFGLQGMGLVGLSQLAPKLQIPFMYESSGDPDPVQPNRNAERKSGTIALRCPIDFKSKDWPTGTYGLDRVSRHSTLWSLGVLCLGSAAVTPFVPEMVAFSFPMVWAVVGSAHSDYRHRRGSGGQLGQEEERSTSNIPFLALMQGRQSWTALRDEIKWTNAGLGLGLASLMALRRLR